MATGVPDAEYRSLEKVHHALLLILFSRGDQVIEREYWVFPGKHKSDEISSITIVTARTLLDIDYEGFRSRVDCVPRVVVLKKFLRYL